MCTCANAMSILYNKRGCKEMLMHRTLLAIVSSTILRCLFIACTILITNLSVDLTSWYQNTRKTITNFHTWSYFFVLAIVMFLQGIVCSKNYLSGIPYPRSRFAKLRGLLTIQNLLIELLYMTVGGIIVWIDLSCKGGRYTSLVRSCDTLPGVCLVEQYYFLLLGGLWAGTNSFCKTYLLSTNYPMFPSIPQSKFFQLERGIYSMISSVIMTSFQSTLYFVLLYYFLGSKFRCFLLWFKPVQMESEPLDSLSGLLNLSLAMHVWLYHLIYALSVGSMYLLLKVYLTEWVPFKIRQPSVYDTTTHDLTLSEAMSLDKVPILQHLGYLDLFVLARKDKARRQSLFTLSEPGGCPYNWNCMAENCLNLLKKFTENINEALRRSKEQRSGYMPSSSASASGLYGGYSPSAIVSKSSSKSPSLSPSPSPLLPGSMQSPVQSSVQSSVPACYTDVSLTNEHFKQRGYIYRMRSLTRTEVSNANTGTTGTQSSPMSKSFSQKFFDGVCQIVSTTLPYRTFKRILAYAFDELEDSKVRYLLLNGQTVIWAVEAISSLSILSLEEDAYGIAQRDLPVIINTLLQVKRSLDKLQKSNLLPRKQLGEDRIIIQMFSSMRSATKRSIYRITTNFKGYIDDLSLEPSAVEQLQHFLQYKE